MKFQKDLIAPTGHAAQNFDRMTISAGCALRVCLHLVKNFGLIYMSDMFLDEVYVVHS